MDRKTVIVAGGVGSAVAVTTGVSAFFLTPGAALGVGALALVATTLGIVLYRHLARLRAQQAALEQQVTHQQEKAASYRREFRQTQRQLQAVKGELSTARSEERSTPENADTRGGVDASGETAAAGTSREPKASATEPSTAGQGTQPPDGEGRSTGPEEAPSLAAVAEDAWGEVETQSTVLEIVDSERLEADQSRLRSTLQRLIQTATAEASGGQVFTSRAIALRAEHRNPHSDLTVKNDGGTPPRRRSDRRVVRVGTTETGVYVDLPCDGRDTQVRLRATLESLREESAAHGWGLGVVSRESGHRVKIEPAAGSTPARAPNG